ncbi:MAG: hypothetical protein KF855_01025 [Acidobacteria bacterium]|nr:hypothetical protein [Acidobacteriota bacterium]
MPSPLSASELLDFAIPIWTAESAMNAQDAYKWLHQATRGAEHALSDIDEAFTKLEAEWNSLSAPFADEPLWQPLRPDGLIGRLHLRPFKNSGGSVIDLQRAFLNSSVMFDSNDEFLYSAWIDLGNRLSASPCGNLSFTDWRVLGEHLQITGFPAMSHSQTYRAAHSPAYRILVDVEMKNLLRQTGK